MSEQLSNTLVMHGNGSMSVRVKGQWRREVKQLTSGEYLALHPQFRERIVITEFDTGRALVEGCRVIVARPGGEN
jgi:hypothetical protein